MVDIHFQYFYGKKFSLFDYNVCANGANCNINMERDLLPRVRFSEKQIRLKLLPWYARLRLKSMNTFGMSQGQKRTLKHARIKLESFCSLRGT